MAADILFIKELKHNNNNLFIKGVLFAGGAPLLFHFFYICIVVQRAINTELVLTYPNQHIKISVISKI